MFCTFCGNQNDAPCLKKTRLYPRGPKNSQERLTERGKICKVCDYKFLMRDKVKHTYMLIENSKHDIVGKLRMLQEGGIEAKTELRQDGQQLESTERQIRELEKSSAEIQKERATLREFYKKKKLACERLEEHQEMLEIERDQMEGRTRKLKHQYGQLLEIMNEFRDLSGKDMLEESLDSMRYT